MPSTAVKPIEAATSSERASMAGAAAMIAELPQIELPQETRVASLSSRPSIRPIP